jgi:hypothetical protein
MGSLLYRLSRRDEKPDGFSITLGKQCLQYPNGVDEPLIIHEAPKGHSPDCPLAHLLMSGLVSPE